jgi:hypothetical protein
MLLISTVHIVPVNPTPDAVLRRRGDLAFLGKVWQGDPALYLPATWLYIWAIWRKDSNEGYIIEACYQCSVELGTSARGLTCCFSSRLQACEACPIPSIPGTRRISFSALEKSFCKSRTYNPYGQR